MKDRNSTLLRAFINEVQETGYFNHPAMIEIVKQHKQEKLAIKPIPTNDELPTQEKEAKDDKIINLEEVKKKEDNPSQIFINIADTNTTITSETTTISQGIKEDSATHQPIVNNSPDNKENSEEKPLPPENDRTKIIFHNYLEYVRKTGDCEYPKLEEYLVNQGLIKQR